MGAHRIGRLILFGLVSVWAAHALGYVLIGVLPSAASIALGMEGAKPAVLSAFEQARAARTYPEILLGLGHGDLGRTLDGVAVSGELARAMGASIPRVMIAFALVLATAVGAAMFRPAHRRTSVTAFNFVAFLPPYVMPMLALLVVLAFLPLSASGDPTSLGIAATLSIAIPPAAMVAAQSAASMAHHICRDYARTLLAQGASPLDQRLRLLHNVIAEITPGLEKVLTSLLATLLFAEPILGLPGFGTMTLRAVRRADLDLVLGAIVVLAATVFVTRLAAIAVRYRYGMER